MSIFSNREAPSRFLLGKQLPLASGLIPGIIRSLFPTFGESRAQRRLELIINNNRGQNKMYLNSLLKAVANSRANFLGALAGRVCW